jgi:hypothetical protein
LEAGLEAVWVAIWVAALVASPVLEVELAASAAWVDSGASGASATLEATAQICWLGCNSDSCRRCKTRR